MSDSKVLDAALCFFHRQARHEHPDGKTDGKRWHPSETERQPCCDRIRSPSAKWPWSLMLHCRTLSHICHLYNVDEPETKKILKTVKLIEKL